MSISQYDFWYDKTCVRYISEIVRAFSGFSYQTGIINGQDPQTLLVPCRVASTNKLIANLMSNLSENTLLSVPLITVYQTGLSGRRSDLQNPVHVDHRQVAERSINPDGTYGRHSGNRYSVDRLMPLPFTMEAQVDIWTSNLQQKYMLLEQILPVVYPQFEIQNSDNALDWTAVTICMVDDEITFSSRTIPVGTGDEIDIASIRLRIPIWLSAPVKVKRMTRIEEVVVNIDEGRSDPITEVVEFGERLEQIIVTPENACIQVTGPTVTLLRADQDPNATMSWSTLIDLYGTLRPTVSKLKLFIDNDIEGAFVTGTLQYTGAKNILAWTVDANTLPVNTLTAVDAVIDPLRSYPSGDLPDVADHQRYLLVNDVGNSVAWGALSAKANDIIEYSAVNSRWSVAFSSSAVTTAQCVLNSHTGSQLRWTGRIWTLLLDGIYEPGHWRLLL
jgi:hypothetical protein